MSPKDSASAGQAPKFYTLEEAAVRLGISPEMLDEWRKEGKIRAKREGAGWMFKAEDVWDLAEMAIEDADLPAAKSADDEAVDLIEEPTRGRPATADDDVPVAEYVPEAEEEMVAVEEPAKKSGSMMILMILLVISLVVAAAVHFGGFLE